MKIWIDILTPKQVLFFKPIIERLRKKGIELLITIRDFRETVELASKHLSEYNPVIIGRYGGGRLSEKLKKSLERSLALLNTVIRFNPNLTISFCSPEAARISFGLGIDHYAVNDIPQAIAVAKLTLPLSVRLYTPWVNPKSAWVKFGISPDDIYQYRGLDPVAWLKEYKFSKNVLHELGISEGEYIVVRTAESYASYQLKYLKTNPPKITQLIERLIKFFPNYKIVIIERYPEKISILHRLFYKHPNIVIPQRSIDGPSIIKYAVGFVGYGGTMTMEAALLGVPTISVRPGELPYYLRFLIKTGLVRHLKSEKYVIKFLHRMMDNKYEIERKAEELFDNMENPADYILTSIIE